MMALDVVHLMLGGPEKAAIAECLAQNLDQKVQRLGSKGSEARLKRFRGSAQKVQRLIRWLITAEWVTFFKGP